MYGLQRQRQKGTPGDAKCATEILWGCKNKELRENKIWSVDSEQNALKYDIWWQQFYIKIVATRCHILTRRLRLCPRPRCGSSQRSPEPLAGFKEVLLLRDGMGGKEREGEWEGKEGEGKGNWGMLYRG